MGLAEDLLNQAHFLSYHERGRPKQATLRRSISTIYYAAFHLLVANAATELVRSNKPYGLVAKVSRAFQHGEMKQVCMVFRNEAPPESLRALLTPRISDDLRFVAATFVALQELRHMADYDTGVSFTRAETRAAVDRVDDLFKAWNRIARSEESRVFLAALAFGTRWSK